VVPYLHSLLRALLDGGERPAPFPVHFTPSKEYPVPKEEAETPHFGEDMNFLSLPECKHCIVQPIA